MRLILIIIVLIADSFYLYNSFKRRKKFDAAMYVISVVSLFIIFLGFSLNKNHIIPEIKRRMNLAHESEVHPSYLTISLKILSTKEGKDYAKNVF